MTTDKMLLNKTGAIARITFNNPEKRNAVSLEMWEAGETMLRVLAQDDDVRVVVFTGAGDKAFVSGADISKFENERATIAAVEQYNATVDRFHELLSNFQKPTIAMIRGFCVGGGMGIAVGCDLRICSDDSQFAVPAARLGLGYTYAGLRRLVEVVGPSFAKEIFFTARRYTAGEARAMGLINRVVPGDELETYVGSLCETIAENAPMTVSSVKRIVGEIMKDADDRDLDLCDRLVADCFASADYIEGRRAFMEKRKPVFIGR